MIIKVTLNDNDFGELLNSFAKEIGNGCYPGEIPEEKELEKAGYTKEEITDHLMDFIKSNKKYREMIKLDKCSKEDKTFLKEVIRKAWNKKIERHEDNKYLTDKFEVDVVDSITSQWENGEVFYIFPSAYRNKVLNF